MTDLTTSLLERKNQSIDKNSNGEENDRNHDDVIENLDESKEDVEEKNGA